MKAPNEKHLEDWIVANPEKVLPRYWVRYNPSGYPLIDRIVRRQPPFPNGRPDLIFEARVAICVLELKKSVVDSDAIVQCYRYLHDLRNIANIRYRQVTDGGSPEIKGPEIGRNIWGFVMGHSVENDNLLTACRAMHVMPLLYDFDGTDYTFKSAMSPFVPDGTEYDWANGAVGDTAWAVMERYKTVGGA